MLQDVAYGISKTKYDSGDVETIARAILTTKYNHTIALYRESCKEISYESLSDSSLLRIFNATKFAHRKCLAGLNDNPAAKIVAGVSFATLEQFANMLNKKSTVEKLLKRYLKAKYQLHCSHLENEVATHSTRFALSDCENIKLQSCIILNDSVCYECNDLLEVFDEVNQI